MEYGRHSADLQHVLLTEHDAAQLHGPSADRLPGRQAFQGQPQPATPAAKHHLTPSPPQSSDSQQSVATQQSQQYSSQGPDLPSSYAQVTQHLQLLAQQHGAAGTATSGQPANNLDVINQQMASMKLGMSAAPFTSPPVPAPQHNFAPDTEPARPYSLFATPQGLSRTLFSSQPSWRSQQPAGQAMSFQDAAPGALSSANIAESKTC